MQQQPITAREDVIAEIRKVGRVLAGVPLGELLLINQREYAREVKENGSLDNLVARRLLREGVMLDAAMQFAAATEAFVDRRG